MLIDVARPLGAPTETMTVGQIIDAYTAHELPADASWAVELVFLRAALTSIFAAGDAGKDVLIGEMIAAPELRDYWIDRLS